MLVAVVPPFCLNASTSDQSGRIRWDVISAMTPACREAVRAGDLSCVYQPAYFDHLSILLRIHCQTRHLVQKSHALQPHAIDSQLHVNLSKAESFDQSHLAF